MATCWTKTGSAATALRTAPTAACLGAEPGAVKDRLLGDGLVPVDSALGRHAKAERRLDFAPERQWLAQGLSHLDLLSSAAVYGQLRSWLLQPR